MSLPYHKQIDLTNIKKLREILEELPSFCSSYFRNIESRTSSRTQISYAYDLRIFFNFLLRSNPKFKHCTSLREITLEDLEHLTILDLEEYSDYVKYRRENQKNADGNEVSRDVLNTRASIKRKIASLRSFYRYLYKDGLIRQNTAELVDFPRLMEKDIIRLDSNEVADFLDEVETGNDLTERQQKFHTKTQLRDSAMMTLLLGTGIRVSECVGLNIHDIDFNNNGIHIHRKGGKEVTVYFGDEVETALKLYLAERKKLIALPGSEDALFLSLRNQRIGVRAVENMVKKYAQTVTPYKHITPHKLRSTYGTNLYQETGDIYLVADVLGHSDINTTKKHYAALEDERRRSARNKVHLRED